MTPGNSRHRARSNERERSVSVVKLGTLRYAASTAKLTDSRMWSLISQGRSLSFTGWPGELFAATRHGGSVSSSERRSASQTGSGSRKTSNTAGTSSSVTSSGPWSASMRGKIIFDKGEFVCTGPALHLDQGIAATSHARRRLSTKSLPACRFGRSARRTRHNFMSRCRVRGGPRMSLPIAR
jgi:hypothetical protein